MLHSDVFLVTVVGLFLAKFSQTNGHELTSDVNRTFAFSNTAPIAKELNRQPWGTYGLLQILAHFEAEGAKVRALARRRRELFTHYTHEACNKHVKSVELERVNRFLSELGLGSLRTRCVTELETERINTPVAAVRTFLAELKNAATAATKWSTTYTYQTYRYADITDQCELMRISAVRTEGRWAIHCGVTSLPPTEYRADGSREQIVELLRLNTLGELEPVPLVLLNSSTGMRANVSTLKEVHGDVHGTSLFNVRKVAADNPAVLAAISLRAHQRQQVLSYTAPSLLAIIMMPVVSSVIPVVCFSDLSSNIVLMYTLVKDIVNAIPLIIKGTELILFGQGTVPQATRTWVYGGERDEDVAVAETWFAECRANMPVVWKGRAFVMIAIFVTLCGILLELMVLKALQGRRKRKMDAEMRKRFEEGRQLWNDAICTRCPCAEAEIEAIATCRLAVP